MDFGECLQFVDIVGVGSTIVYICDDSVFLLAGIFLNAAVTSTFASVFVPILYEKWREKSSRNSAEKAKTQPLPKSEPVELPSVPS